MSSIVCVVMLIDNVWTVLKVIAKHKRCDQKDTDVTETFKQRRGKKKQLTDHTVTELIGMSLKCRQMFVILLVPLQACVCVVSLMCGW